MIKIATEEDFDLVLKHTIDSTAAFKLKDLVQEDQLKRIITNILTSPKEEKIILLHGEEGMLAAFITPFLFGLAPIANELGWWVVPEARKKNVGRELVEAYEFWARKLNCKHIVLSCYADNDLGKFYEKIGYTLHEKTYYKELN